MTEVRSKRRALLPLVFTSNCFKKAFTSENQMERKFLGKNVQYLSIPHEVVLFFGNDANSQFSIQR